MNSEKDYAVCLWVYKIVYLVDDPFTSLNRGIVISNLLLCCIIELLPLVF